MKPKISVITPLFNKQKTVNRAVNSVLLQTFTNLELLIINDGSTDNSIEALKCFDDSRMRIIHQKNAGPGAARNRGVKEAKGNFVAFLDADDEWLPEFIEMTYKALKNNPDCDLCVTSFFYSNTVNIASYEYDEGKWSLPANLNPIEFKEHLDSLHSAGTLLCKREIVELYDGFYENKCTYGEDAYLWLKVILNSQIYRLNTPLFIYHTEASELSCTSGRDYLPPKPYLLHPDPIRQVCPRQHEEMLEQFLAYWALRAYHNSLGMNKGELCRDFLKNFSLMKEVNLLSYLLLRGKLHFPQMYRLLKTIRKF